MVDELLEVCVLELLPGLALLPQLVRAVGDVAAARVRQEHENAAPEERKEILAVRFGASTMKKI